VADIKHDAMMSYAF